MSKCKWCGAECAEETCSAECAAVYAKYQAHPENYPTRVAEPAKKSGKGKE